MTTRESYEALQYAVLGLERAREEFIFVLPFAKRPEKGASFDHLVDMHVRRMAHHARTILEFIKE
jgi:hypothetical protein